MITGKNEELTAMADNNVCAADGGHLSVAWDAAASMYYLRCGVCNVTRGIKRVLSLTEELRAGAELPEPIKSNVKKGMAKRQAKQSALAGAVTMGGIPATDLGTGELLKLEVLEALVDYAHKYELDPARGHVCLMYGKPYITLDGYLYHAHEVNIPYRMASHPLTKEEREQYQVKEGDHAWLCELTKLPSGTYFTSLGIVTAEEISARSDRHPDQLRSPVVARHPWQLAQKRAEWQALRRAFPIGETEEATHD
jgi:hypothetical protein